MSHSFDQQPKKTRLQEPAKFNNQTSSASYIFLFVEQHTWFREICKLSMSGAIFERLP